MGPVILIVVGSGLTLWFGIIRGLFPVLRTAMIRRAGIPVYGEVGLTRPRRIQYMERRGTSIYIPRVTVHHEGLIAFTTLDGTSVEFWADLDDSDTPKPGREGYALRYLAKNPNVHRFARPRFVSAWAVALYGLAIGGVSLGLGVWLVGRPG
jgi:hypothetical protein